ncbi:hypothetical protein BKA62DRAFT_732277, partial [Auriculariales sp. MPI-PUGE-AT-0066]
TSHSLPGISNEQVLLSGAREAPAPARCGYTSCPWRTTDGLSLQFKEEVSGRTSCTYEEDTACEYNSKVSGPCPSSLSPSFAAVATVFDFDPLVFLPWPHTPLPPFATHYLLLPRAGGRTTWYENAYLPCASFELDRTGHRGSSADTRKI